MDSKFFIQLPELNFPENYQFRLRKNEKSIFIFCLLRKKWFVLTPEEWVRQHTIHYLIYNKRYSVASIKAEHPVKINDLKQRVDLLVYNKSTPYILIECKKPKVVISQATLDQAMRYNQMIGAKYIYLTNGIEHIVAEIKRENIIFHKEIPTNIK